MIRVFLISQSSSIAELFCFPKADGWPLIGQPSVISPLFVCARVCYWRNMLLMSAPLCSFRLLLRL